MGCRELPQEIIMILGNNLRRFYSSIYVDKENKLNNILGERFESTQGSIFISYEENKMYSDSEFSIYFSMLKKTTPKKEREGKVFFLKNKKDGVIYLLSNQNKDFLKKVVAPFFYKEYPNLFHITYSSKELKEGLKYTEDFLDINLFSERFSEKRIYGRKAETRVEYKQGEHPPFDLVFKKAREEGLWIDWIKVLSDHEKQPYKFSLSRNGRFRFISGDIVHFLCILERFGEMGLKKHELLSNREIREDEEPKPLLIKYHRDIFDDKKNREGLIETFEDYTRCSYSVIHKGNPHIYMYVSDRMDNSSYSIRNVGNSKLMITPQTSSSPAAFNRLIGFLNSNFMDPFEIEGI